MEDMGELVGKTIQSVEKEERCISFTFDDGSSVTIYARGTEEQWIEVS